MYRIELRRKAQQDLDKLPKKDFEAVIETIKELANTPRPKGIEKLKGSGLWRVRRGDYRIVYNIDDKQSLVIIVRIGNRRDIYRSL
ncbi:type II toxin-antitoxin system RelE family toxin [Dehalococcoides mccartyi]|uniref:type II toxin-antitoxin system RelE family toxin n=1 Tax=Dehalococcoides mccartyi TaxID=61435 RepID=UPI0006BD2C97|nr:type II toxin-antitoxin system RelE/ParE family toxin [Dehalococcoides mccartyi]OBW61213.1 MAG: addiction module antitoxin [Dehalococcoides mccartyi]QYY57815.1 type II toxin-antitoxin system RelE/ParE family toxin [Dehalococcoides mccartyi]BAS32091.1 addiction module antitoxin [Dehalococcoides mccartyi IBARAKI]BEL01152.1 type II toxin-antitoxin system RelE/ParE family toxin [Dehalococcoides mccartyi]